ncbi:MAG: DUF4402 domain-containing protein [Lutibacter sp.]|nr:DUF4402 domain-containing protein [Lutibacter sp.]
MKKQLLSFAAIILIAGFSTKMMAQTTNTDSATSDAFATIVSPISITHDGIDLEFGTIISGVGTVTVTTGSVRSFTVAAMNPGDQGATPTAAVFSVAGQPNYTYSIAFTNATETLTETGFDTMSAGTFVASTLSEGIGAVGTLDGSGDDTLNVGATLTVTAGLNTGLYTGSFEVTVAYN